MASIDIIEEVSKYIGDSPVPKIDPNTQAPQSEKELFPDRKGAVIPALLVGFYKHTRNETQAEELMAETDAEKSLNILFGDKKNDVIKSIADYERIKTENVTTDLQNSIFIIKKVLEKEFETINGKTISSFFTDQRSNILKHLPAELNMGNLMNDPSVDDRTNKMEGPMSGIMHSIEKIFSSTK